MHKAWCGCELPCCTFALAESFTDSSLPPDGVLMIDGSETAESTEPELIKLGASEILTIT